METRLIHLSEISADEAESAYKEAGRILRDGGMVAFPTETVYGLGANALDSDAAVKIYAAKERPSNNPLIAHIADEAMLYDLAAEVPEKAKILMKAFWPGPLTMVFHKKDIVPLQTTGGLETVAVRMPDHPVALRLIREAGVPVAAPSANTSGKPSPTSAMRTMEDMDGKINMILDGGECRIGIESTIVDMTEEIPMILRPGFITDRMMEALIGPVCVDPAILQKPSEDLRPKAPGQAYRHYAPNAPMVLIEGRNQDRVTNKIIDLVQEAHDQGMRAGVICTEESKAFYDAEVVRSIGSRENIESVAHNLYEILREFNEVSVDVIFSEAFPEDQLGSAIMNRMVRAAGHQEINVDEEWESADEAEELDSRAEESQAEAEALRNAEEEAQAEAEALKKAEEEAQAQAEAKKEEQTKQVVKSVLDNALKTQETGEYSRVIFVGADNMCESIMAEAIMKKAAGTSPIEILSRGLVVLFPEPVNPKAVEVLASHGLAPSKECSEELTAADITEKTLILTMKEGQAQRVINSFLSGDDAPAGCKASTLMGFVGVSGEHNTPAGDLASYEEAFMKLDMWVKVAAQHIVVNLSEPEPEEEDIHAKDIEDAIDQAFQAAVSETMEDKMLEVEERRRKEREASLLQEYMEVVEKAAAREAAREVAVSEYKILYEEIKAEKELKRQQEQEAQLRATFEASAEENEAAKESAEDSGNNAATDAE